MRFTAFIAAIFAVGSFAAPTLETRAQCSADNQNYIDNLSCPSIQALSGLLQFQGDSVGTFSRNALTELNKLLVSDDPVSTIGKDAFNGAALGLTQGITFTLQSVAATLPQLNPNCRCNLVACNNAIMGSQRQCQLTPAGTTLNGGAQTSCGQTIFNCASFYSRDQINQMTGCCQKYEGLQNA